MKKILLIFAILTSVLNVSARDTYSHDAAILPEKAQAVVDVFPAEISHIRIGKEFGHIREYDVVLTDGSEIYFDKHGNWKDIEVSLSSSVPRTLILRPIVNYIRDNYKKTKVTGIEMSHLGYDVELSNGAELHFSLKGKFLRNIN